MREERGQLSGDVLVYEPFTLWGSVGGNVRVIQGGKLYVRGAIYGNLTVEFGGRVHILGNVSGDVTVQRGAKVIHTGMIGGDAINEGGRLFIEAASKVLGRIKTRSGDTVTEAGFKPSES
jgi:cytoskeletal protein CcmA (bactofilin family)